SHTLRIKFQALGRTPAARPKLFKNYSPPTSPSALTNSPPRGFFSSRTGSRIQNPKHPRGDPRTKTPMQIKHLIKAFPPKLPTQSKPGSQPCFSAKRPKA